MSAEPIQYTSGSHEVLSIAEAFVPLCSLKSSYLNFLLQQQSNVDYVCEGFSLFEKGDCDYRHIYLLHGTVRLNFPSGFSEVISALENLYPISNEMPRSCSAVAESDCTLLTIDSDRLDRILSWSQISQYLLSDLSIERDYDEDIDWIKTVLNSNLFYKVPPVNAGLILDRMVSQSVMKGDVILRQGEIGSCCYFIKEGAAAVTCQNVSEGHVHLADIGLGRCFGEDALVYETVRNATVTMTTDGVLMRLDKKDFKLLLLEPEIDEITENDCSGLLEAPVFVDIRTSEEYQEGHLAMSVNLPLSLLSIKKRLLKVDTPYVFYCDTGRRSKAAAYLLGKQGYNTVSLEGGLQGAGMQHQIIKGEGHVLKNGQAIKG